MRPTPERAPRMYDGAMGTRLRKVEQWLALVGTPIALVGLAWSIGKDVYERREVIEIRPSIRTHRGLDVDEMQRLLLSKDETVQLYFEILNEGDRPAYITSVGPRYFELEEPGTEIPPGGFRVVRTVPIRLKDWPNAWGLQPASAHSISLYVRTTKSTYQAMVPIDDIVRSKIRDTATHRERETAPSAQWAAATLGFIACPLRPPEGWEARALCGCFGPLLQPAGPAAGRGHKSSRIPVCFLRAGCAAARLEGPATERPGSRLISSPPLSFALGTHPGENQIASWPVVFSEP